MQKLPSYSFVWLAVVVFLVVIQLHKADKFQGFFVFVHLCSFLEPTPDLIRLRQLPSIFFIQDLASTRAGAGESRECGPPDSSTERLHREQTGSVTPSNMPRLTSAILPATT